MGAQCDNSGQGKPQGVNAPIIRQILGYTPGNIALECVKWGSQKNSPGEAQGEPEDPGSDADTPATSGHNKDGRTKQKKPINALGHMEGQLKQRVEDYLSRKASKDPDKPNTI